MTIIPEIEKTFAVGVELGKPADGTAISVVESVTSPTVASDPGWDEHSFHLRYLERLPQGATYREIAKCLLEVLSADELNPSRTKTSGGTYRYVQPTVLLAIDQTVVSTQLAMMILNIVKRSARRVRISGSHTEGSQNEVTCIPKQELIGLLEARLETNQLMFSKALPATQLLADELIQYRERKTTHNVLTADAWREHPSEDLVFAVALACWALQGIRFSYEFL